MNTHASTQYSRARSVSNHVAEAPITTPRPALRLPLYARDGRKLQWNEDHTAVMFDSTDTEYHSDYHAASSSALKLLDRSPAHLHQTRLNALTGANNRTSKALLFGTAVHSAVLEPSDFAKKYLLFPTKAANPSRSSKAFKTFEEDHPSARILMPEEAARVQSAATRISATTVIRSNAGSFTMADLVQLGVKERNIYWIDDATGVTCKARLDLTVENIVLDVKTAEDARYDRFKYDAAKYGYHIQAAFYMAGFAKFMQRGRPIIMMFAVVESAAPHATAVYQADKETFWEFGAKRVAELLPIYKQCMATQIWPAYAPETQLLKLPLSKLYQAPKFNFNY